MSKIYCCNGCGQKIGSKLFKIMIGEVDSKEFEMKGLFAEEDLDDIDLCEACATKFKDSILDLASKELPDPMETEKKAPRKSFSIQEIEEIMEMRLKGYKAKEIAEWFGVGVSSIYKVYKDVKKDSTPAEQSPEQEDESKPEEPSEPDQPSENVVSKKKTAPAPVPIQVCKKNCMVCRYVSAAGYCDFFSITHTERKDKSGLCTHRKLRGSKQG